MPYKTTDFVRKFAVVMLLLGVTMTVTHRFDARADDDEDTQQRPTVTNAKWASECTACHVAYPARYLPAESWRAIMAGLDKHFGSNASLDAADANEITDFLVKNADTRKKSYQVSGKPLLRITETRRFKSEHREVAQHIWKNAKVKSRANCGACHTRAESGDFSERNVKIPR